MSHKAYLNLSDFPRPWTQGEGQNLGLVFSADHKIVCVTQHPDLVGIIVALAEDRDALLAACKLVMRTCGFPENWNGDTHEFLVACQAAIAKAEERAAP